MRFSMRNLRCLTHCSPGSRWLFNPAIFCYSTDLKGAARDAWLGAMGLQASNEERRSETLFSRADRPRGQARLLKLNTRLSSGPN